jgi:hypothetical protein
MSDITTTATDTRQVFAKLGTCSRTLCYLLDREFGHPEEAGERAADPLVGGIMLRGHQCGMLWGAALAAGAESHRRHGHRGQAAAMEAARRLVESFEKRTGSVNCREITGHDFTKTLDLVKFMVRFMLFIDRSCFDLAEQWAPEAIQSAAGGLSREQAGLPQMMNCASLVAGKMGAGDREQVMVAGFAGGLGLSGNACGALSAAIWIKTLAWGGEHPGKSGYRNPRAKRALQAFLGAAGSEMLCHRITGRRFKNMADHSDFMKDGGCARIIEALAQS